MSHSVTRFAMVICLVSALAGSEVHATDSPLQFTLPPNLQMGVSGSKTTAVIADPTRIHDKTAPVIILQLVPTNTTSSQNITLQLLRDAQRVVVPEGSEMVALEPIQLKDGTPVSMNYYVRQQPYSAELYGLAPVHSGVLFARIVLHQADDYRYYAHYLKQILSTMTVR